MRKKKLHVQSREVRKIRNNKNIQLQIFHIAVIEVV